MLAQRRELKELGDEVILEINKYEAAQSPIPLDYINFIKDKVDKIEQTTREKLSLVLP